MTTSKRACVLISSRRSPRAMTTRSRIAATVVTLVVRAGAIAALATGCVEHAADGTPPEPGETGTTTGELTWRGDLFALEASSPIEGAALTATDAGERAFKASATIHNDAANYDRPWRVYYGTCVSGGAVVGEASAYPRLATDQNGDATSTAWITVPLDTTAAYHVTVHYSDRAMGRIIACGDLALQ